METKDFYFPLKKLEDAKVYEYRAVGSEMPPLYRYFRTVVQGEQVFLTEATYDGNLNVTQFTREEKLPDGMMLRDKILYFPDKNDRALPVKTTVEVGAVFPFSVTDSNGIFVYNISFTNPVDSNKVRIIRNRRFLQKLTYNFEGKNYDAIEFDIKVADEYENQGTLSLKSTIREIYANGIGLVETHQTYEGYAPVKYRLHAIYTMEELEKKLKSQ